MRDLASRNILEALPVREESENTVVDLLAWLFSLHGAPLVVKSDNGGSFSSEKVRDFFLSCGVRNLFSPPGTPSYNGAAEAGLGTLQGHGFYEAARNGRLGSWSLDDLYVAKCRSNATVCSDDSLGRTPEQIFKERKEITPGDRMAFLLSCEHNEKKAREELGLFPGIELSRAEQDGVDRIALSRALVEQGYLTFRGRWIPPAISYRKLARIS